MLLHYKQLHTSFLKKNEPVLNETDFTAEHFYIAHNTVLYSICRIKAPQLTYLRTSIKKASLYKILDIKYKNAKKINKNKKST